jgi:hypothetical protein
MARATQWKRKTSEIRKFWNVLFGEVLPVEQELLMSHFACPPPRLSLCEHYLVSLRYQFYLGVSALAV